MRARSTVEICYRIILLKIITIARPHHPTLAPNLNGALNRDKKKEENLVGSLLQSSTAEKIVIGFQQQCVAQYVQRRISRS